MTGGRASFLGDRKRVIALVLAAGFFHGLLLAFLPTGRFLKYTLAAEQWLSGDLPIERWLDFSPFLFHLAVLAERLGDSALWLTRAQIVLVAACAGLAYALLEPHFGRRWAVAGAVVLLLDRHLVIYGRMIEPEIWLLALVLGALVAAERGRLAPAGVLMAAALTVRPTVLPLILLVPAWWWLRRGEAEGGTTDRPTAGRDRALRAALRCWAPCVLALFALAWRAHVATGSWTTPSMNPGTVFFEGHNPASRGVSAEYPPSVRALWDASSDRLVPDAAHVFYRRVARADLPGLDVAGVNGYWQGKAASFLADEPWLALRRSGTKLLYSLHSFAWHDLPQASLYALRLPWLPALPFGALSALALVGMAVSVPHWRQRLLYFALVGCQLGVMVLFYASARQRILLLPALIFFAIAGCRYLADGSRHRRRRGLTALLTGVLALALTLPTDAMAAKRFEVESWIRLQGAQQRYVQAASSVPRGLAGPEDAVQAPVHEARVALAATAGRRLDRVGDPLLLTADVCADAATFLSALLASGELTDVQASKVGLDAAWLWLAASNPHEALASLRPGVADDRPVEAWLRARALSASGRREEAVRTLDDALGSFPGRAELLAERIVLDPRGSERGRALLERYWSGADGWWLLSRAHAFHGHGGEAARYRELIAQHFPELDRNPNRSRSMKQRLP